MLRTLWYGPSSRQWFEFLDADAHRRKLTRTHPVLAEKLHRPYRRSDLDAEGRLLHLVSHCLAVEALGWQSLVLSLSSRPLTIATVNGKDDVERQLVLDHSRQFAKEGELCLHLCRGNERLYSAAFSFVGSPQEEPDSSRIVLDVGCLQGPVGESADEVVRVTTKALHGLRPRDFMAMTVRFIAQEAGARHVVGVSSGRHIYRHWRKRKAISFDYDAFWLEQQGRPRGDGDFEMATECEFRPIDQLPSKKRSEARRRRDLLTDVQRQVSFTIASWADQNRNDEALSLVDEAVALGGPFASTAEQTRAPIRKKMTAQR
jgi:uncharacterized protein VirK/YbjX